METRYKELELLIKKFTRQIPDTEEYNKRLEEELELIARMRQRGFKLSVVAIWPRQSGKLI